MEVFREDWSMKHRFAAVLAAGLVAATAAPPARAQSVHGWLDVVDQQSAIGWACVPGDANTKVPIELWAWDNATGNWSSIGNTSADKQRADVGRAGVCGAGLESNYHGFEFPIYPYNILVANKSWSVYAYYRPTGQYLSGSPRPLNFPLSGLPTSGFWRTDYEDLNVKSPALLGCNWPFHGANSRVLDSRDPLWVSAGPTWPGGLPRGGNIGYQTMPPNNNYCINYDPTQAAPVWDASNFGTSAPSWPTSNYWVVHANYEPAYVRVPGGGPPGQSQPVATATGAGMYSLQGNGSSFRMRIDKGRKPANAGVGIPFLSFGAQMGRGVAGPLAVFDPTISEASVQFTATKNADTSPDYHQMAVFIEAVWEGRKRWAWILLQDRRSQAGTVQRLHWNWNVYNSIFYPGAEIDFIPAQVLRNSCGINTIPSMEGVPAGVPQSYNIPVGRVFGCVDSLLGWSNVRPFWQPLVITGIHFAMELPDGANNIEDLSSVLDVTYSLPQLIR
jgi:hypothetical protein